MVKREQTCTFQTCTLFSARFLASTASRPPLMASFPPPSFSIASTLSELKWAITSPKKGQAKQRCHEEQTKGARLSREEEDDDHDQDLLSENVVHIWSWSSEILLLRRRRTMTMTKIPSRKAWFTYGHGPLIFPFHCPPLIWGCLRSGKSKLFRGSLTNTLRVLWCICIFLLFPWKQAFWYTPNLFFACWGAWVFKAENTFGVFRPSLRGGLLKGGYNNSLHVPLAIPTPAPTPPPDPLFSSLAPQAPPPYPPSPPPTQGPPIGTHKQMR